MSGSLLKQLAESDIPEVKSLVDDYMNLGIKLRNKEISQDDYDNLVSAILILKAVDDEKFDPRVIQLLKEVVQTIINLKSLASS